MSRLNGAKPNTLGSFLWSQAVDQSGIIPLYHSRGRASKVEIRDCNYPPATVHGDYPGFRKQIVTRYVSE